MGMDMDMDMDMDAMNLTLEETKLYHYRLWDEIVKMLPYDTSGCLPVVKDDAIEKLQEKGLLPKHHPKASCYLCEYYYHDVCNVCPLNGCGIYYDATDAFEAGEISKAVELAESIRDIYKTYDDKKEDEK